MLATFVLSALASAPDFASDMGAAALVYDPVQARTEPQIVAVDLAGAQQLFLDAVPEPKRTAAHWFLLGNLWYDLDPAFASRMHEHAYALAPEQDDVAREWALELHRARKWADAERVYSKIHAGDPDADGAIAALRAHCLLRLGRHAEAAETWKATRGIERRGHIAHLFAWTRPASSGIGARVRWVQELRAGDLAHAEDLLLGDVFWGVEDGEYVVHYAYMEADGALVSATLGEPSERAQDLNALAGVLFLDWEQRFPKGADSRPREELFRVAHERHWIGAGARLPSHPRVARCVIDALLRHEQDPAALLAAHQGELLRRARSTPPDAEAAHALVRLARAAKSKELGDFRKLEPRPLALVRRDEVDGARKAGAPLVEPLVQEIEAELASDGPSPERLDAAFEELAHALPEAR